MLDTFRLESSLIEDLVFIVEFVIEIEIVAILRFLDRDFKRDLNVIKNI